MCVSSWEIADAGAMREKQSLFSHHPPRPKGPGRAIFGLVNLNRVPPTHNVLFF